MAVQTRSVKSMAELVAAAKKEPTVEAGVTAVLQGVANQLLTAVWAEWSGDKLALPNFATELNASVGALVAAILEDVAPTQAQIEQASQELSVAKTQIQAQVQAQANAKAPAPGQAPAPAPYGGVPQPVQNQASYGAPYGAAASTGSPSQAEISAAKARIAQAQGAQQQQNPADVQLVASARAAGLTS
jgi:hypothetical protein